jgi:hypothetical protein
MNQKRLAHLLILFLISGVSEVAYAAEDEEDSKKDEPKEEVQKTRLRGKSTREKEAEGTKAPNRFESEVVIKSKYKHDGESLEVDPD